jgi:surface protein
MAFITRWKITDPLTLTLPLSCHGKYDFMITWGDASPAEHYDNHICSHTYEKEGEYTVGITGTIEGWDNRKDERIKAIMHKRSMTELIEVCQWGCLKMGDEGQQFAEWYELVVTATDAPDLTDIHDLRGMFRNCHKLTGNFWNWDVSAVRNMQSMFEGCYEFNGDITEWNVSNVTNMNSMFRRASSFNQPISGWDVSKVKYMDHMFEGALSFNQPISDWDVSKVKKIGCMSEGALSFNQPIDWV